MCEREVIRLPAGWQGRRVGVVLVGGDVGFSEPIALQAELLAANLLICYLIDRPPASGVRD
jgi:hypothetical protein